MVHVVLHVLHEALGRLVTNIQIPRECLLQDGIQAKVDVVILVPEMRDRFVHDFLPGLRSIHPREYIFAKQQLSEDDTV